MGPNKYQIFRFRLKASQASEPKAPRKAQPLVRRDGIQTIEICGFWSSYQPVVEARQESALRVRVVMDEGASLSS